MKQILFCMGAIASMLQQPPFPPYRIDLFDAYMRGYNTVQEGVTTW